MLLLEDRSLRDGTSPGCSAILPNELDRRLFRRRRNQALPGLLKAVETIQDVYALLADVLVGHALLLVALIRPQERAATRDGSRAQMRMNRGELLAGT
jgi:hypothetical protein